MRTLIGVTLACLSSAAFAGDVYRWTDEKGVVHYSDKPQAPSDKPVELPHLQTYNHGSNPQGLPAPPETPQPAAPKAASGDGTFSIASPAPDETIRDAEGKFTVSVSGTLQPGEGVIYYLDGAAENKDPTPSTAFLYARVERGEHTVSAALIGADGRELERTPAVTVHVKPPTAKH
jgi:hypothetical protein